MTEQYSDPKLTEGAKLTGEVTVLLNGSPIFTQNNLVVTTGREHAASRLKDATDTPMSHIGIGTGTAAAVLGDTTLGAEVAREASSTPVLSTNTVQYTANFAAGTGTGAITEAGLFNAAAAGDMFARTVFPVVNKGASDTMSVVWTITMS